MWWDCLRGGLEEKESKVALPITLNCLLNINLLLWHNWVSDEEDSQRSLFISKKWNR
jgi:hypothetical protein